MRFCTSIEASLESVPGTKLAVISTWLSESLVDFEIEDAVGAVEFLLDQPRDAVIEVLRRSTGVTCADRDRRWRDDGILRDGQKRDGEQSAKADQEGDDPGEDGPIDKEGGHRSEPLLWR
jgi:hypothetical protein